MTAEEALMRFITDTNFLFLSEHDEQYKYNYIVAHAIEKQIPKKVIKRDAFLHRGICQFCNIYVIDEYCPHCGQKIDWGDTK